MGSRWGRWGQVGSGGAGGARWVRWVGQVGSGGVRWVEWAGRDCQVVSWSSWADAAQQVKGMHNFLPQPKTVVY